MSLSMDRQIAIEWIERLESLDPETQAKGSLNANGKMCCLGVLTEIAVEHGVMQRIEKGDDRPVGYLSVDAEPDIDYAETMYLPYEVAEWAGIDSFDSREDSSNTNPYFGNDYAAVHNDGGGKSFKDIAALLREELGLPKD